MVTYNGKKMLMGNLMSKKPDSRATANNSSSLPPYNASNWPLYGSNGNMIENALIASNHHIVGPDQMFVHPLPTGGIRDSSKNYYFGAMDIKFSYENITSIDQTYNNDLPGQIADNKYTLLNTAITQLIEDDKELFKIIYTFTIQAEENITIGSLGLYKQIYVNGVTMQNVLIAWNNLGYKHIVKRKETEIFTLELEL